MQTSGRANVWQSLNPNMLMQKQCTKKPFYTRTSHVRMPQAHARLHERQGHHARHVCRPQQAVIARRATFVVALAKMLLCGLASTPCLSATYRIPKTYNLITLN